MSILFLILDGGQLSMKSNNTYYPMAKFLLVIAIFSIFNFSNLHGMSFSSFFKGNEESPSLLQRSLSFVKRNKYAAAAVSGAMLFGLYQAWEKVGSRTRFIPVAREEEFQTFTKWKNACELLPTIYELRRRERYAYRALSEDEFERAIQELMAALHKDGFFDEQKWLYGNVLSQDSVAYSNTSEGIAQQRQASYFVQKIITSPEATISLHADIHGDIHSVIKYLVDLFQRDILNDDFQIVDPNFYMVFLGDYSDRGCYSAEVIYTMARLKAKNPRNIILLRGNHEDFRLNAAFGLKQELNIKFGDEEEIYDDFEEVLGSFYSILPSAVYIGPEAIEPAESDYQDYALLCHGGIDPRFNPHGLLKDGRSVLYQQIDRADISWLSANLRKKILRFERDLPFGFLWNDFSDRTNTFFRDAKKARGLVLGKKPTKKILQACCSSEDGYRVTCVFRGHQHSGSLLRHMIKNRGIYNFWVRNQWGPDNKILLHEGGPIWTLNVSPGNGYGRRYGYNYDTHAILTMRGTADNWTLQRRNVIVF